MTRLAAVLSALLAVGCAKTKESPVEAPQEGTAPQAQVESSGGEWVKLDDLVADCEQGLKLACGRLGAIADDMISGEHGERRNPARGMGLHEFACENGHTLSCASASIHLLAPESVREKTGIEGDAARATKLAVKACSGIAPKDVPSDVHGILGQVCRVAGGASFDLRTGGEDPVRAATHYRRGCEFGDATSCYVLGYMFRKGRGVEKDGLKAATDFGRACDLELGAGCAMLADMYQVGDGVQKDTQRMLKYAQRGCELGDAMGCTTYGLTLVYGWAGPAEPEKGMRLLAKPCEDGIARACAALGHMYLDGTVVPKDEEKADRLLSVGCKQKSMSACAQLGFLRCDIADPRSNCAAAIAPWRVACLEQDQSGACFVLGVALLGNAPGVANRPERAAEALSHGCQLEDG